MTTLRQAAEMALEALENCRKENEEHLRSHGITIYTGEYHATSAINKLREALAQPEQEPVAYRTVNNVGAYVYHSADRLPNEYGLRGEALYLHPAPAIPEGWQLVPEEPTLEMEQAAWRANAVLERGMVDVYKAMLAAAPKYEVQSK